MKKVLEILEATTGGTRRHLADLVSGLDRTRFELILVVSMRRRDPEFERDVEKYRREGLDVRIVPMRRRIAPFSDAAAFWNLWRLFRNLAPDIVHAHSAKAGVLGRAAARLAGVPRVLYTPHGYSFEMRVSGGGRRLFRTLEKIAARWTDGYLCVCRSEYEQTLGLGVPPERCRIVYNGVDPPASPSPPPRDGAGSDRWVIGCIGRLCVQKGQDVLADAAPGILREDPRIHLVIVGDGPLRSRLENRLREWIAGGRVRLRPQVSEREIPGILDGLDLLVMPSRWEGLPYGLLDAMAHGLPVVASRVGGIAEMIADGVEGVLAPPEDVGALEDAVRRCARDPEGRKKMGAAARRRVAGRTRRAMIEAIEQVYSESPAR